MKVELFIMFGIILKIKISLKKANKKELLKNKVKI